MQKSSSVCGGAARTVSVVEVIWSSFGRLCFWVAEAISVGVGSLCLWFQWFMEIEPLTMSLIMSLRQNKVTALHLYTNTVDDRERHSKSPTSRWKQNLYQPVNVTFKYIHNNTWLSLLINIKQNKLISARFKVTLNGCIFLSYYLNVIQQLQKSMYFLYLITKKLSHHHHLHHPPRCSKDPMTITP